MFHARPEYAITLAILGILLAIGIPSLLRGQVIVGVLCLVTAAVLVGWVIVALNRERG